MAATTREATTSQNPQTSSPGNVSEIQRLTSESDRLARTVDSWNMWYLGFGIAALLVAFLVFFAQWRIIRKGKELASVQSDLIAAKDRQAIIDTKDQDERIAAAQAKAASSDAIAGKANEQAGHAEEKAANANERAAKAEASLASAEQHSAEANAKAEGFRLDIAKSNEAAAQAQAQVAGAMAEAAKANLELARIKAPRTFALNSDTLSAFREYPGTEYTFSMVATDEESIEFLKQIDSALQAAGWKRVKPDPPAVMGANVFGDEEPRITIGILKGVKVEVGSAMDADALQKESPAMWPMAVKLAGALRNAIASLTTPSSDANVAPSVGVTKGVTEVIRISVGSKP